MVALGFGLLAPALPDGLALPEGLALLDELPEGDGLFAEADGAGALAVPPVFGDGVPPGAEEGVGDPPLPPADGVPPEVGEEAG
ncbi:MAG TPA: hypothetical protein VK020_13545 [Microlunatus sp.]|nr:hypothetical protein [Microlunatus sp.]